MGRSVLTGPHDVEVRLEGQQKSQLGPVLAVVGVVVIVLLMAGTSITAIQFDEPTFAVLFGSVGAMMLVWLCGVLAAALPARRNRMRVRAHDDGLEIVGSPWPRMSESLGTIPLFVGTVVGIVLLRGDLEANPQTVGPIVLLAGFTVASVVMAHKNVTGRRPSDFLVLRREGFSASRAGSLETFAWTDVLGFDLGLRGMTIVFQGYAGTSVPYAAAELRSDPALVAELLDYYRTHERERSELAFGRALDRVRAGDFRQSDTGAGR